MNAKYVYYQHIKELKDDYLNLAQCWLYSILYHHQIYPPESFEFRTVYGVQTPVTTSKKLTEYVDQLFKDLSTNTMAINYFEVQVLADGTPTYSYRFLVGFPDTKYYNTRHQKQTEFKYFVSEMVKGLKGTTVRGVKRSFNFMIEYRHEKGKVFKSGKFIDNWIKKPEREKEQMQQEAQIGSSVKLADMAVMIFKNRLY